VNNPVLQWQIVASDPEGTSSFYRELFGWTVTNANALGYRQIDTGPGMSGGLWPAPPGTKGFVQLFVGVQDVEQAVADAMRLGASVIVPPAVLPDGDHVAILADPNGIPFGIMRH